MSGKIDIYAYRRKGFKQRETEHKSGKWKVLKSSVVSPRHLSETIFYVLISFIFGRAIILNDLLPFGIAFLAGVYSVMPEKGWLILIAVILGTLTVSAGMTLWGSVLVAVFLLIVLKQVYLTFRQKWFGIPLLVLAIDIIVKSTLLTIYKSELYGYISVIFEAFLAAIFSYIFINGIIGLKRKNFANVKKEELYSALLILIGIVAGLTGIQFQGISLRGIISTLAIIVATYAGGSGAGAAIGTFIGIVPSLSSSLAPNLIGVYAFSGLLSGAFRNLGRIGIAIGFVLGNIILSIYFVDNNHLLGMLIETGIAVTIFLIIPQKFLVQLKNWFRNVYGDFSSSSKSDRRIREVTSLRINEFARVFKELSQTFEQITCELQSRDENDLQILFNSISSKVCTGCTVYRICWEKDFYKTYKDIIDLFALLETKGKIDENDIPHNIKKRCFRLKELAIIVSCLYDTHKLNQYWHKKLNESRDIVANQLNGVSSIMHNLASEIKVDVELQEDIEIILRRELFKQGFPINDISVIDIKDGNLEIKINKPSCGGKLQCVHKINPLISKLTGQKFTVLNSNYCTKKTGEAICEFKLYPAMTYQIRYGTAKAAKTGGLICGDNYSALELRDGKFALILSDGMGVGASAAMESNATISLLEKLLETGFDKDLSIKIVNSILVLRSPEETFATVDLAIVDLFSGLVDFVKIGSVASFVKRGAQISVVKTNSLPIGILNTIEVDSIQKQLDSGDIIVLVSDGVLDVNKNNDAVDNEEWFMRSLKSIISNDPQDIADFLLERAMAQGGGQVNDDMSILVAKIEQRFN